MKLVYSDDDMFKTASTTEQLHLYNGMDCMVTAEILEVLLAEADETALSTYTFTRNLMGPLLEMSLRGVRVNTVRRAEIADEFTSLKTRVYANLQRILHEGLGITYEFNPKSPVQVKHLLYDILGLHPILKRNPGTGRYEPTTNEAALLKLRVNFHVSTILQHILTLRDLEKKLGFLKTKIDSDGRMRTSFAPAGTVTGRLASSFNELGEGTNLQNIQERLREIFVADEGKKFANIDLEQGDSRNVGGIIWNIFGDPKYLDACESGDLHTTVAKLTWPELAWTNDPRADRELAESPYYRHHGRRHMCKVLGHGTNYLGQPKTMAEHTKIDVPTINSFQSKYFEAFPIRAWHEWVRDELRSKGFLISPHFLRRRYFFGRRDDPATIRDAVAHVPQSMTADEINTGLIQVWKLDLVQILLQVHDSILIQYPEEKEDEILSKVMPALRVPVNIGRGRTMIVPADCKTGWNWGPHSPTNPDGLKKYTAHDERKRLQGIGNILDRRFS